MENTEIEKYCNCMEEIKRRTSVITSFLNNEITTKYIITNNESICLQFRKVLELIALASLVANKEEYSKQHEKFANHWNAKRILSDIEKINPDYYPVPTRQIKDNSTGKVIETEPIQAGFLTKEEFIKILDTCGNVLHANNPYGVEVDVANVNVKFDEWLDKIIQLLNHHQIQLVDADTQLWVLMQAENDGKVHAFIMEKVEEGAEP